MREFWIHKGESRFADELRMNDDFELVKVTPDSFYDLVSPNDTIEGGIHVREVLPESPKVNEDLDKAASDHAESEGDNGNAEISFKAGAEWQKDKDAKEMPDTDHIRAMEIVREVKVRERTIKDVLATLKSKGHWAAVDFLQSKFLNGEGKK